MSISSCNLVNLGSISRQTLDQPKRFCFQLYNPSHCEICLLRLFCIPSIPLLMHSQLLISSLQVIIVLSCLISISVNFSTFLVIGKTSPVTYQVLGHLKTCLVLAFGYILLRDPFSWRNILGILIAMIGMILYSYYCTHENQQKAAEAATQSSQVCLHK